MTRLLLLATFSLHASLQARLADGTKVVGDVQAQQTLPLLDLRIALYGGPGAILTDPDFPYEITLKKAAGALTKNATLQVLGNSSDIVVKLSRDNFDMLFVPGGMGHVQAEGLGEKGIDRIRNFVHEEGGGYVGTCGGAFLALDWLRFYGNGPDGKGIPAQSLGEGRIKVQFTKQGLDEFSSLDRNELGGGKNISIEYMGGPAIKSQDTLPSHVGILASYTTDLPRGLRLPGATYYGNTPAITYASYGKGRVVLNSPHPEHVKSAAGVGPAIYQGEIAWAVRRNIDKKSDVFV